MKLLLLIISCFLLTKPSLVSAYTSVKFDVDHAVESGTAKTEVMVTEVYEDELALAIADYEEFLKAPEDKAVPLKAIYSVPSESFGRERGWDTHIGQEEIFSAFDKTKFDEVSRVEIPEEFFEQDLPRVPQSEKPSEELVKAFDRYYKKSFRVRRITLIGSRTVVNGAVATLGFIAGGMPTEPAMVLGSITGLMSGSMQLVAKPMLDFLSTNAFEIKIRKLLGLKPVELKTSKFLSSQMKWFSTEFLFLTMLDISRFSLHQMAPTALGPEAMNLGMTAFKSLASQGLVDTSVAKEFEPLISRAILEGDLAKAAKLRFKTEIIAFSSSMTWAGAAITDMMGLPVGNYLFMGMGAAGGGNHLRLILKDKGNKLSGPLPGILGCNWFFKKRRL